MKLVFIISLFTLTVVSPSFATGTDQCTLDCASNTTGTQADMLLCVDTCISNYAAANGIGTSSSAPASSTAQGTPNLTKIVGEVTHVTENADGSTTLVVSASQGREISTRLNAGLAANTANKAAAEQAFGRLNSYLDKQQASTAGPQTVFGLENVSGGASEDAFNADVQSQAAKTVANITTVQAAKAKDDAGCNQISTVLGHQAAGCQ